MLPAIILPLAPLFVPEVNASPVPAPEYEGTPAAEGLY